MINFNEEHPTAKGIRNMFGQPDILVKGGEGSRGGKVIGHTKSGKPIYEGAKADHESYKDFNDKDHMEATFAHRDHSNKLSKKIQKLGYGHKDTPALIDKMGQASDAVDSHFKRLKYDGTDPFDDVKDNHIVRKAIEVPQGLQNMFDRYIKQIKDVLEKGEGDRGGKVIGHTRSGKPIYEDSKHEAHKDFTFNDHQDAAGIHHKSKPAREKNEGKYGSENADYHMGNHMDASTKIRKETFKKYKENEEDNDHGANAEMLAHQFGTKEEQDKIKEINKRADNPSEGMSEDDFNASRAITKPHYDNHLKPFEIKKAIEQTELQLGADILNTLEKGRKAEPIGTRKTWGGKDYVKTANGWTPKNEIKEAHDKIHGGGEKKEEKYPEGSKVKLKTGPEGVVGYKKENGQRYVKFPDASDGFFDESDFEEPGYKSDNVEFDTNKPYKTDSGMGGSYKLKYLGKKEDGKHHFMNDSGHKDYGHGNVYKYDSEEAKKQIKPY